MTDRITVAQIEKQYLPGWVILDEVEMNAENSLVQSGRLVYHSTNKTDCFHKLTGLKKSGLAFIYVGQQQEHPIYML